MDASPQGAAGNVEKHMLRSQAMSDEELELQATDLLPVAADVAAMLGGAQTPFTQPRCDLPGGSALRTSFLIRMTADDSCGPCACTARMARPLERSVATPSAGQTGIRQRLVGAFLPSLPWGDGRRPVRGSFAASRWRV